MKRFKDYYAIRDFEPGMRVQVCRLTSYSSRKNVDKLEFAYGTVDRVELHWEKVCVRIDNLTNNMSGSGNFYFKASELKIVNDIKEENNMSYIKNYLNIAKIKFLDEHGDRTYDHANFDASLRPNDICVVMTANHGMALAKVAEILPRNDIEITREIVSKVFTDDYDERVKIRKQAAELKAKMQERAKQLQDVALYKMLAENDPAMMELLNEYQSLPET